jgi:hypothetical protein
LDWNRHLVYTGDEHHDGAQVVDIDNDGDLDIISIGWTHNRVVLYENMASAGTSPPPSTYKHQQFLPIITQGARVNIVSQCTPEQGLLALYLFDEGSGTVIHDISGVEPALDLLISDGDAQWLAGGGLSINTPVLISSAGAADKINEAIRQGNQFTLEAWIKPNNIEQDGPARIITLSADSQNRNFTLGQGLWNDQPSALYDVRLRTTGTNDNGQPSLTTQDGSANTNMTHLAYVRQANGNSFIYINGAVVTSDQIDGDLSNWDTSYGMSLANEVDGGRPWLGEFYRLVVYNCALNSEDIKQNFDVGWLADDGKQPVSTHIFHYKYRHLRTYD